MLNLIKRWTNWTKGSTKTRKTKQDAANANVNTDLTKLNKKVAQKKTQDIINSSTITFLIILNNKANAKIKEHNTINTNTTNKITTFNNKVNTNHTTLTNSFNNVDSKLNTHAQLSAASTQMQEHRMATANLFSWSHLTLKGGSIDCDFSLIGHTSSHSYLKLVNP